MTNWFTSDEHYGHFNIVKYCFRPFGTVEDMTRELVAKHNAVVGKDDTVWHLGDFAFDKKLISEVLSQLNGTHHLVSGNHDETHPCHKKHEAAIRKYCLLGFASVRHEVHLGPYVMNHLPYRGDRSEHDRYPEHRPVDDGKWLLHGHVHEKWKIRERMINVGVDQWGFAPVHWDQLEEIRNS